MTTGELNRFVETLHFEERKILYITQTGDAAAFVYSVYG